MAGYRLCQTRKAKHPFYIENISTNIFTMEELCFYISQNLYLLDESILNTTLTGWLREELKLVDLSRKLGKRLEEKAGLSDLIIPIIREIHYLSQGEMKELRQKLMHMEEQPLSERYRKKGDCLIAYCKYGNAVRVYRDILGELDDSEENEEIRGKINHNLGCAYMRLFQREKALECFEKAYASLKTDKSRKSLLAAMALEYSSKEFDEQAVKLGMDSSSVGRLLEEIKDKNAREVQDSQYQELMALHKEGREEECLQRIDRTLYYLEKEYHRDTGL